MSIARMSDDIRKFMLLDEEEAKFNPELWPSQMAYRDELEQLGGLSRQTVRDAFKESYSKGVIFSLVWGYPKGKTSGRAPGVTGKGKLLDDKAELAKLQQVVLDPEMLADKVERFKGTTSTALNTITSLNSGDGLKTASTSKIAYFAGLDTREGHCLIYDIQVTKSILLLAYPELDPLKRLIAPKYSLESVTKAFVNNTAWRKTSYPMYLTGIYQLAKQKEYADIEAEDIERFLFNRLRGQSIEEILKICPNER